MTSIKARTGASPGLALRIEMRIDRDMRRIPGVAWRALWRSVAALVVFAQVAAAADQCLPIRPGGEPQAAVAIADVHHALDPHCASGLVPADQAPASEPKRLAPDMSAAVPAAWSALAPDAVAPPARHAPTRAGPPLRLQFRNFRL